MHSMQYASSLFNNSCHWVFLIQFSISVDQDFMAEKYRMLYWRASHHSYWWLYYPQIFEWGNNSIKVSWGQYSQNVSIPCDILWKFGGHEIKSACPLPVGYVYVSRVAW